MTWQELRDSLSRTFTPTELEKLDRAYSFAEKKHSGQKRMSGDPYLEHCLQTAKILYEIHSDPDAISAGLLHDCLEDTDTKREELEAQFGREIADLVEGVTKISTRLFRDSEERKAENLRKIMLAMVRDIRVIVIKLADRLHNMRTLEFLPQEKRTRLARETVEIYAALAHRLGMGRMKNELEDLAFRHLYPEEYRNLTASIEKFEAPRVQNIQEVQHEIDLLMKEAGIQAQISGRMKHLFSLWNKMRFQKKELDQIYDLMAIRIIVPGLKDCYAALGIVHAHWKPLPGRFKDYIATPKSNLYQSLHTTVVGSSGEPFEIQIRTQEMHNTAEEGIAAHWSYKEGRKSGQGYETKLAWFRQFLDWQQDLRDSKEFMESLKIDLFEDEVFVFTPRGEVKSMTRGATPIDFAYLIHSRLGDTLVGAKVNSRMVPLKYELKNGDIVEVVTRADAHPSRDWMKIAKTTKAKNRIRHFFRLEEKEAMEARGKALLEEDLQRCGTSLAEVSKKDALLEVAQKMNFKALDEFFVQIGDGNLSSRSILAKLGLNPPSGPLPAAPGDSAALPQRGAKGESVRVGGLTGMVMRFAQCCHPIPCDPIIGFLTQGRGISIHQKQCPNVQDLRQEPGRIMAVAWEEVQDALHALQVMVVAQDRERLLADLLQVFYDGSAVVKGTETRTNKQNLAEGTFTIEVKSKEHLKEIMQKLERVKGVIKVGRK